ncbi:MAG: polysaccharide deacetylase, partial [Clostridia bacterium]|nr:polysaccharide deacetylase [Clostridia bacterium]
MSWKNQKTLHKILIAAGAAAIVIGIVLFLILFFGIDPAPAEQEDQKEQQSATEQAEQKQAEQAAQALILEADALAAGYDYQGAIALLKSYEQFDLVPALADKVAAYQKADGELVVYEDMSKVTHIFFHSLIVDPARAFDGEYSEANAGYNQYMTTVTEFNAMLEELYRRDYVLVSPYDVAHEVNENGKTSFAYGELRLPKGKKPFVMSQDDLNYYSFMVCDKNGAGDIPAFADKNGDGYASKVVVGEDGYPTCEYIDENGKVTYGDYDLVPLLEKFIQAHPDFSYHGARAILGMTGYEGVFGYRTKPVYEATMGAERYQKEVEEAKAVAQCLRDHGWILASHSYAHHGYGNISAERVKLDSEKWEKTVQPIIGDCDILLYPNGSDIAGEGPYTMDNAKFKALYADGYRYFYNVDSSIYWSQLGDTYFRGGRRNLDGYRMYHNPKLLADLFDSEKIFDPRHT